MTKQPNNMDPIYHCIMTARDMGMTVLTENDGDPYDHSRKVYNARIDFKPFAIAYCRSAEDVSHWLKCLTAHKRSRKFPIVVRSGGHHHEGMCVETGAVVLDLSEMNRMTFDLGDEPTDRLPGYATLDTACQLGNVVNELASRNRIIPVGGCQQVNVGGLTQGGGWGASYRRLGLTIDWLEDVEIVIPNGEILTLGKDGVSEDDAHKLPEDVPDNGRQLFWAICGGGGGNFGVITKFRFRLTIPEPTVCSVEFIFRRQDRSIVLKRFVKLMESGETALTLACRLTVVEKNQDFDDGNPAILILGRYFGDIQAGERAVEFLTRGLEHKGRGVFIPESVNEVDRISNAYLFKDGGSYLSGSGDMLLAQSYALQPGARSMAQRMSSCDFGDDPEPHKVSSSFPSGASGIETFIHDYLIESQENPFSGRVNNYITIHGMGGVGNEPATDATAFFWRQKPYMLQIQAWWGEEENHQAQKIMEWVCDFRDKLSGYTEGGFINFPDHQVAVADYYSDNYTALQKVKYDYDKDELLKFGMSVKPENS